MIVGDDPPQKKKKKNPTMKFMLDTCINVATFL